MLVDSELKPVNDRFEPVSETSGTIRKAYINLRGIGSPFVYAELALIKAINDSIPGVKFILGYPREGIPPIHSRNYPGMSQREAIERHLDADGISNYTLFEKPKEDQTGIWARDQGVWADQGNTFVIPVATNNQYLPGRESLEVLKIVLGVERILITDLPFEGGDMIATDDKIFMGFNCIKKNGLDERQARDRFTKELIILGDQENGGPLPHLDSSAMALSNQDFLIDSPALMGTAVASLSARDFADWERRAKLWFSDKEPASTFGTYSQQVTGFLEYFSMMIRTSRRFERLTSTEHSSVETIIDQLDQAGINPVCLPGLDVGFPFSATNCLVDVYQNERRVFVTNFDQPKIDAVMKHALDATEKVNNIIPVGPIYPFLLFRGGPRCVANVLRE